MHVCRLTYRQVQVLPPPTIPTGLLQLERARRDVTRLILAPTTCCARVPRLAAILRIGYVAWIVGMTPFASGTGPVTTENPWGDELRASG